jgi:MFS family permease
MTDISARFAEGEFRVGRVLSRTSSVLSRNFLTFFVVTIVAYLPLLLIPTAASSAGANPGAAGVGLIFLGGFLTMVLGMLSQAVVLYGAFQDMRGRPVNLGESLKVGLRRFLPILGLAILMSISLMLGFFLLVIPGLILFAMWFVATPACVVEQLGPFRSMGRSSQLTKGHRWKVFGLILVLIIISAVVGSVVSVILSLFGSPVLTLIGGLLWNGIWGAIYSIAVVVTYHDLRAAKEGVDIEHIAAVFD